MKSCLRGDYRAHIRQILQQRLMRMPKRQFEGLLVATLFPVREFFRGDSIILHSLKSPWQAVSFLGIKYDCGPAHHGLPSVRVLFVRLFTVR